MVEFIKQEANEKANEIRVAADEVRRSLRALTSRTRLGFVVPTPSGADVRRFAAHGATEDSRSHGETRVRRTRAMLRTYVVLH
jgi:hypothetical protein